MAMLRLCAHSSCARAVAKTCVAMGALHPSYKRNDGKVQLCYLVFRLLAFVLGVLRLFRQVRMHDIACF